MNDIRLPIISQTCSQPLWINDSFMLAHPLASTQRSDYTGHFHVTRRPGLACLRAPSFKPKVSAYMSTVPIGSVTSLNWSRIEGYVDDPYRRRRLPAHKGQLEIPKTSFFNESCYQEQFTRKDSEKRSPYKPMHDPLKSEEPFASLSTYAEDFRQSSAVDRSFLNRTPPRIIRTAVAPADRIQNNLLAWTNATTATVPVEKSADILTHDTSRQFQSETSYSTQFRYRPVTPRRPYVRPDVATKCLDPFEGMTNYRDEFTPKVADQSTKSTVLQNLSSMGYSSGGPPSVLTETLHPYLEHSKTMFYTTVAAN